MQFLKSSALKFEKRSYEGVSKSFRIES